MPIALRINVHLTLRLHACYLYVECTPITVVSRLTASSLARTRHAPPIQLTKHQVETNDPAYSCTLAYCHALDLLCWRAQTLCQTHTQHPAKPLYHRGYHHRGYQPLWLYHGISGSPRLSRARLVVN